MPSVWGHSQGWLGRWRIVSTRKPPADDNYGSKTRLVGILGEETNGKLNLLWEEINGWTTMLSNEAEVFKKDVGHCDVDVNGLTWLPVVKG